MTTRVPTCLDGYERVENENSLADKKLFEQNLIAIYVRIHKYMVENERVSKTERAKLCSNG